MKYEKYFFDLLIVKNVKINFEKSEKKSKTRKKDRNIYKNMFLDQILLILNRTQTFGPNLNRI